MGFNDWMAYIDWQEPVRLLERSNGPATQAQHDLGVILGLRLDFSVCRKVAVALLEDRVEPAIHGRPASMATDRQLAFLEGIAPSSAPFLQYSKRVASAWIDYYLAERSILALRSLQLGRGDRVIAETQFAPYGEEPTTSVRSGVVSSIGANGRVYFMGRNGGGAWPSQLRSEDS